MPVFGLRTIVLSVVALVIAQHGVRAVYFFFDRFAPELVIQHVIVIHFLLRLGDVSSIVSAKIVLLYVWDGLVCAFKSV